MFKFMYIRRFGGCRIHGLTCRLIPAALAACLLPGLARADDLEDCNAFAVVERVLSCCTLVVRQGTRSRQDIGKAYVNRSSANARQGMLDEALADADSAVQLDPESTAALLNRAFVQRQKWRANE